MLLPAQEIILIVEILKYNLIFLTHLTSLNGNIGCACTHLFHKRPGVCLLG